MNWLHKLEECNRHKKGFNQHEKSVVHRSAVNSFIDVSSSTDDIVGTVTKNLLEIQQKKSALLKILDSIRFLVHQRLLLRSHNDSESNFRQLYCGQKEIVTFRNGFSKKQTNLLHWPFKMKF